MNKLSIVHVVELRFNVEQEHVQTVDVVLVVINKEGLKMSPKLREYMKQIEKETGVTSTIQKILYERYGYILKKVRDVNGEM